MKAAILGTQHPDVIETEREILLVAGAEGFRHLGGYVPAKMPIDKYTLSPIDEFSLNSAHEYMSAFCGRTVTDCNPRVPYLVAIWLLFGTDNPYRLHQYINDDTVLRQVAGLLMRLVMGERYQHLPILIWPKYDAHNWLSTQIFDLAVAPSLVQTIRKILLLQGACQITEWVINSMDSPIMVSHQVKFSVKMCAEIWRSLSDEELMPIIRQLMVDILSSENRVH